MTEHFFIVGAQRSGTTYLYTLLDEHPEIDMAKPRRPEPKFFLDDTLYKQGLDFYEARFFNAGSPTHLGGEKSTSYIESNVAAQRIATCFPKANILFVLREPVDRAISNYRFSVSNGFETLPIWDAFMRESERLDDYDRDQVSASPYAYLRRGHYMTYIQMYERYFPRDQINVILHEELTQDAGVIRDLYGYLGVATDFLPPSFGEIINKGEGISCSFSREQREHMRRGFIESNARLAEHCSLNLSCWEISE